MQIHDSFSAYYLEEVGGEFIQHPSGLSILFGDEEHRFTEQYYTTLSFEELGFPDEHPKSEPSRTDMTTMARRLDLEIFTERADRLLYKDLFPEFDPDQHTEYDDHHGDCDGKVFLKKVNLLSYLADDPKGLFRTKERVSAELRTCEMLGTCPHPNLATYLGCRVQKGFVTGLYYRQYGHLEDETPIPVEKYVAEMREGIEHLHSLGVCHNDINPYNVMVKHDKLCVIIDFDSCLPFGESMLKWPPLGFDREAKVSEQENDWFGLERSELWMRQWNEREGQKKAEDRSKWRNEAATMGKSLMVNWEAYEREAGVSMPTFARAVQLARFHPAIGPW